MNKIQFDIEPLKSDVSNTQFAIEQFLSLQDFGFYFSAGTSHSQQCLHEVLSLRIPSITVLESGLGVYRIVKLLVII